MIKKNKAKFNARMTKAMTRPKPLRVEEVGRWCIARLLFEDPRGMFAMAALQGLVARGESPVDAASKAYAYADEMMKRGAKK